MRRVFWCALGVGGFLLMPGWLSAQADASQQVASVKELFTEALNDWPTLFRGVASSLFLGLLALESVVTYADFTKGRVGLEEMAAQTFRKLGVISAVVAVFQIPGFLSGIVGGFEYLATLPWGNGESVSPGSIFEEGLLLYGEAMRMGIDMAWGHVAVAYEWTDLFMAENSSWNPLGGIGAAMQAWMLLLTLAGFESFVAFAVLSASGILLVLAFAMIALQVLRVQVETVFLLALGALFVPFVAFRITAGMTEAYLKSLVEAGMRMFLVIALAGAGRSITDVVWRPLIATSLGAKRVVLPASAPIGGGRTFEIPIIYVDNFLIVIATMGLFVYVVWALPGRTAGKLSDVRFNLSPAVAGK